MLNEKSLSLYEKSLLRLNEKAQHFRACFVVFDTIAYIVATVHNIIAAMYDMK